MFGNVEPARGARRRELADALQARSTALGVASSWEIDDVIDPDGLLQGRRTLLQSLRAPVAVQILEVLVGQAHRHLGNPWTRERHAQ